MLPYTLGFPTKIEQIFIEEQTAASPAHPDHEESDPLGCIVKKEKTDVNGDTCNCLILRKTEEMDMVPFSFGIKKEETRKFYDDVETFPIYLKNEDIDPTFLPYNTYKEERIDIGETSISLNPETKDMLDHFASIKGNMDILNLKSELDIDKFSDASEHIDDVQLEPFDGSLFPGDLFPSANMVNSVELQKRGVTNKQPATNNIRLLTVTSVDIETDLLNHSEYNLGLLASSKVCQRSDTCSDLMRVHMSHSEDKTVDCGLCSPMISNEPELIVNTETLRYKPFTCDLCSYRAYKKSLLDRHMNVHSIEKLFECNQCSYRTSYKSNLKRHKSFIHSEDFYKHFVCSQCHYRSPTKSRLKTHMTIHSSEKPFACKQCSYRTYLRTNLKRHMTIHSGEKSFACNHCLYRASQKSNLKRHMTIHSKYKHCFTCNQCSYRSFQKSNLKRHMTLHSRYKVCCVQSVCL